MSLLPAYDWTWYEFEDEDDPKSYGVLLCDFAHGAPPWKPLYIGIGWYWYYHGVRYGAETLHLPSTHGWDSRFRDGMPYITVIPTTDEEAKQREPIFRERIKPYIEDFDAIWEPLKAELAAAYQDLKKKYGIEKYEDIKKLTNMELLMMFLDYSLDVNRKEGEYHMICMIPLNYIFGLFQEMWGEIFGVPAPIDPLYARVMGGFESELFRANKEMWRLGIRAEELGLGELFQTIEDNELLLSKLEEMDAGRKWLSEYREFLERYGWRCERMQDYATPTWIEKPSLGIPSIKVQMAAGKTYGLDEELKRRTKEREEAEKEALAKVPLEKREWFAALMRTGQKAGYWAEDHVMFCDFPIAALGRWITMEFGRRFTEAGVIDDPEDVHFLHPDEIRKAAIPMARVNLRPYVERRRKEWERNMQTEPKPFYGNIGLAGDVVMRDPTLSVATQAPIVREELKADLYGAASAPGIVEGVARVIMTVDKLAEIKPGEILVSPGTAPPWTPAFTIISGVVCDGGGSMAHAVIVAREYGIPAVSGCVEATKKIKTGDRLRVDGNLGVVYILG
jgi:pyruvate,water dikinase